MAGGKIRAVLFDKDGTLFDFDATWGAWAKARIDAMAVDETHALAMAEAIGFDLVTAEFDAHSAVIAGTVEEAAELLLPHLPGRDLPGLVAELDAAARDVPLVAPVPLGELLGGLKARGLRLGICTNDAESTARAHAERAGVSQMFDAIIGYDSGHGAKPTPRPLLAFADALGIDPAEVVMIGDSLHDMRAARAAGMVAVAVLSGPASRAELEPNADAVLDHIGGLPDWLTRSGR
ncbi:MAG: HAD family hydrolase [Thioclava marina]|jgi:haloacid dehalogenase superfamily, subfamily IA, variant 3 with third motif having DD or ED/haloacid dehalogenase superfamily, subfamily IA, variant 1 with third motif having Dx(3-4)D or Dx(3-4)E|uniref:phosphoglycolate phosphatase n=1 Tax=Thioclava marina TaxID=1915077 RepID=A0ABX3MPP5_9RHOB|nr:MULTISPECIES: HAD family hydrolase [Thioclava]TNE88044.1 MAG: HAD family hydrolase [Paracoccaceae bacterium]MBC7145187.1 HAD family hydrolase [Thioclava marina]OOY13367.1 phosphatase [Thioclava marina]OOY29079.1 phosphatase [Thioclava sp. L04-15]TNF15206.1 MAG: HAD family hydrolase [Paracoccaceae bacterium]